MHRPPAPEWRSEFKDKDRDKLIRIQRRRGTSLEDGDKIILIRKTDTTRLERRRQTKSNLLFCNATPVDPSMVCFGSPWAQPGSALRHALQEPLSRTPSWPYFQ